MDLIDSFILSGTCLCQKQTELLAERLFVTPGTVAHQTPVHGIFQARILEWVAISFSRGRGAVFPTQGSHLVLLHLQAGCLPENDKKKSSVIFSALRKPSEFSPISPLIGGNNRRCLYGGGGCTSACWKPCSEGSELCLGDEDFCKRSDESCYRRTHSGKEQPSSLLNTSYLTQYSRILLVCLDGSWVCDSN